MIQVEGLCVRISHDANHPEAFHQLGEIHLKRGTYDEAEDCYRLAQAIYCSMEDIRGEATTLIQLGVLYFHQRRQGEAEECFTEARVTYTRLADEEGEARVLDWLFVAQYRSVDAKAACVEAREIYARTGQPMSERCALTW